jgi:starvation-inducible DNA-binding protein
MASTLHIAPEQAALTAAAELQQLLPELVALSLEAKQAHWNVTGPSFLALHALTDEIAVHARSWADRMAERAVALGFTVDARPGTVAVVAGEFPSGRLVDPPAASGTAWPSAAVELGIRIDHVAAVVHSVLAALVDTDAVAHDLTVAVLEGLERYAWLLRAQST